MTFKFVGPCRIFEWGNYAFDIWKTDIGPDKCQSKRGKSVQHLKTVQDNDIITTDHTGSNVWPAVWAISDELE